LHPWKFSKKWKYLFITLTTLIVVSYKLEADKKNCRDFAGGLGHGFGGGEVTGLEGVVNVQNKFVNNNKLLFTEN